jgi:glycosyltransferase involved in cell wall biosynthesis
VLRTVVHVVSTADRCGPINVVRGIVENLDRKRYCATIATLSPEGGNSCIDELRSLNVDVEQLNLSRAGSFAFGRARLARTVRDANADVIHTHGIRASVLGAKIEALCPVVSTLHCDLIRDYRLEYGGVAGGLMARIEYAALKHYDGVAAVSESVARSARDAGIEARVIPNGIDLSLYVPPGNAEEVQSLRRNFGWPAGAVIVLHTGALIERKNPVGVIDAFRASKLADSALLVFAGDGPLRSACGRHAAGVSSIVFLGKRADVANLLKAADFLVSNSSMEGLPLAILEGCASGIHVVASGIAPHDNIRRIFPEQVTLFNRMSRGAITETLEKLVEEKVQRVQYPPAKSLELVSGNAMSKTYQDFYDELLALPSGRTATRGSLTYVQ